MKQLKDLALLLFIFTATLACTSSDKTEKPLPDYETVPQINLPDGFKIHVYAENVDNARSMVLGDKGTLFVGSRTAGKVYAIIDKDQDYQADQVIVIADNMNQPNGVAFLNGDLYVAEISKIWKFENIEEHLNSPPAPVLISDDFPTDGHHGWKYIAFGPDGKLYVPVGAPCNICLSDDEIYASITRMDPDGSNHEIFAHGIRNTVGFDWHPEDGTLWFTDNGRDWLGDNLPPDELNQAPQAGMHFGYPFCHSTGIADPEFGDQRNCDEFSFPVQDLGPHVAALGMLFYTGDMFPESYRNSILIAEHGSWNRSTPIGYRITRVELNGNTAVSYETFANGWLQNESPWGRPVDVIQMPNGSILVSDDTSGTIYNITYSSE
ncbi:PQQ-dependent sugar dehydrogenase [Draconibacterium halophilum]|uniref:Sorbosone dehydrogenase family protein n=1 Tax=Draconibacterium halophilum TaxID=2706887 RepID=A0A6C0REY8_9BACT|nr:sorbosone dehydrogenase family protein [Draconibacterium halophilum]QIA08245.1 sorbosone dehydrogenase family protein [Draconibacterium halophilum]